MTKGKIKKAVGKKESEPFTFKERFRLTPWTDDFLSEIAQAMMAWVNDPNNDAVKLAEFAIKYQVSYNAIIDNSEHHEELRNAVDYSKEALGAKREKMALIGKWNPTLVMATMGMYDRDFRRNYEWKAKLSQKDTTPGSVTVVMQPYPDSDKVPVKKEKK